MTASTASAASGYLAISRRTLDLEDYIDLARRHASWIFGPIFAGLVISIVVAFSMPNTYVSQAEMQITPAQISESIVPVTINQLLTDRIIQMENEILSRTTLSNIIQDPRLDLYKSDRASKPLEDVIETMRNRDIRIRIESLPGNGGRRASAFSISFSYPDRFKAQQTVQTLVTKFVDANQDSQRKQQNMVHTFVNDEMAGAKAKLDQLDQELTKFRIENSGKLPEQSTLNVAQLTALQQQANSINDALNRLAQQRVQLDTHLQTLQSQLELFNMFDKDTDPVNPAPRPSDRLIALNRVITETESSLAQMRQIYKPTYPDIRDAENRLQVLRRERDDLQKQQEAEQAAQKAPGKKTTSFQSAQSLSSVQGQIDATRAQLKSLEMEQENRRKEQNLNRTMLEGYQSRLTATSGIEARYADLVRNEKAAMEKYQILQSKQQLTEQNGELLQRKAGENLDVLDPPSLPVQPSKPNRWFIVGAGVAIAFLVGFALAYFQEAKDTSLKNLKDVRAYTNLPVLTSVPLLENTMVVRRKRRMVYLAWSAAVIVGLVAVSASLYYHYVIAV